MMLQPYQHDGLCPKCHYMHGTTRYERSYHDNTNALPCGATIDVNAHRQTEPLGQLTTARLYQDLSTLTPEERVHRTWYETLWELIRTVPEHFDRSCPNCGYVWAEAVV